MAKYTNVKVNISEGQRKKLKSALENSIDQVSIHLDSQDLMRGDDVLALTKRQLTIWRRRIIIERVLDLR